MLVLATVLVVAGLLVSAFVPWWRDRRGSVPRAARQDDGSSAAWIASGVSGSDAGAHAGHADAGCSDGGGASDGGSSDGGGCH